VLLEYSLGDSASYLFALTGREIRLHRLPPRDAIEAEVRRLRAALAKPSASGDSTLVRSARALYLQCLAPVRDLLPAARQVILVPDGALQFLPFEVLLEEDPPAPPHMAGQREAYFASLSYAFRKSEVNYGPSSTVLAILATQPRRPDTRGFFGIGDPVFSAPGMDSAGSAGGTGSLSPLPQTGLEVESIAGFFPPAERTVLLGMDARESSIAALGDLGRFRILHFATHGLVDERRPERSSLALSYPRDPSEDGYLQAAEIYRLHLGAELVVLSACETGVGRMVRGEGVLGLPRAFLYAGASSVLVSLWSVSDRSTAELMTEFYRTLMREDKSPGQALRSAQRELRAKPGYSHPFYWAPFILIGPPTPGRK
jgi:CHAT domain-containing protein